MSKIYAGIDYIRGKVRSAYYELTLSDSEMLEFENLPRNKKIEIIERDGEIVIDDYTIDDIGKINYIDF